MYPKLRRICYLLLMLLSCSVVFAQQRTVSGTITNKDTHEPLQGVTVAIKGADRVTTTNDKGQFSITASNESVLKITAIGFVYQEVPVGDQSAVDIALQIDNRHMDEVVVVGYGTQRKSHATGSIASLDPKKIEELPVGNLSEALKGQIVGVSVVGGYARPGEPANIVIRNPVYYAKDGQSTNPLYVIDDVIRSKADFDLLDASEIENLSVLKDAAAAIYGILGANGVVVVKTKRGRIGSSTISYIASVGVTDAVKMPKMMNGYQMATYLNDYNTIKYGKFDSTKSDFYFQDELDYFKAHNYNWLDMAWQKATEMRHALNISGGSDKATYFAGFTYNTQNSNFDGLRYNRYTFRASSDIKLTTGLKLGLSVSANLSDKKNTFNKQGGESLDNDWKTLVGEAQFDPPFVNGLPILIQGAGTSANINTYHYFAVHNSDNYTWTKGNGVNFQGQLSYELPFIKGLKASLNYNRNFLNNWGKQYGTKYNVYQFNMLGGNKHIYDTTVSRVFTFSNGDRVRLNPNYTDVYQLNTTVNYDRAFGKHEINALFGYEQSEAFADGVAGMVEGVVVGGLDNQSNATGDQTSSETVSESGRLAYIGRLDYSYANKYLLELQFRADASQNFAPENRWGYFPSVSGGWVISEEPFFGGALHRVNFLKIRASYGHLGTDNTKGYQWLRSYAIQTGKSAVFNGNADRGLAVVTTLELPNRAVHWDNVDKYNAGIDARFLQNRLSASLDAYIDYRTNLLSSLQSSPSILIGAPLPTENFGKVNTFGYEASLNWRDNIGKDWTYNVTANFNWTGDKVLRTDVSKGNIGTYLDPIGKPSDMGYLGYHALGIFRTQAQVDEWLAKYPNYKIFGNAPKPGMLYFQDVRGPQDPSGKFTGPDGTITSADLDFLKNKSNNHFGLGLNWGVSYKTITLNVVMGMSWGGIDEVESAARKLGTAYSNRPAFWADHWTPENPNAAYPAPYYNFSYDVPTDFWWRSSYSFRVHSFNLGYTLPQRTANKAGFKSAKFYLVGTNPLNFFNPFSYKDNINGSYDTFPELKAFSLGLNLTL